MSKIYNNSCEMSKLRKSKNTVDVIIGFVYYYSVKIEKNAIINQLYRQILDSYSPGMTFNVLEKLKETTHYKNIKYFKSIINDVEFLSSFEINLSKYNIPLKTFIKTLNDMVNTYTKLFGRLVYKLNKDIGEIQKQYMPTFNNVNISEYINSLEQK